MSKVTFARQYSFTREIWKKSERDNSQFPIFLPIVKNVFFERCIEMPTMNSPKFFLETNQFWRFTLDLKGSKWLHWSNCSILDNRKRLSFWNKPTWQEQKRLHVIYLRAQVNFRQLPAESAGNRYLRRFLPATAVILPADQFTCGLRRYFCTRQFYSLPSIDCCLELNDIQSQNKHFVEYNCFENSKVEENDWTEQKFGQSWWNWISKPNSNQKLSFELQSRCHDDETTFGRLLLSVYVDKSKCCYSLRQNKFQTIIVTSENAKFWPVKIYSDIISNAFFSKKNVAVFWYYNAHLTLLCSTHIYNVERKSSTQNAGIERFFFKFSPTDARFGHYLNLKYFCHHIIAKLPKNATEKLRLLKAIKIGVFFGKIDVFIEKNWNFSILLTVVNLM